MGDFTTGAHSHHPFPRERFLPYLTTNEIRDLPKERAVVLLPIGSIEQHGPHLPVITDALIGQLLLARTLELVEKSAAIWVLPQLTYGRSTEHHRFPGTMTLSGETLRAVVTDIAVSVAGAGFRRLVLLNSHGGNPEVLEYIGRDIRDSTGLIVFPLTVFRMGLDYGIHSDTEEFWGTHAGEWETSLMLELAPELIRMDRIGDAGGYPSFRSEMEHITLRGDVKFSWLTDDITTTGALGDPRLGTATHGETIAKATVEKLANVLEEMAVFEMPTPAGGGNDS